VDGVVARGVPGSGGRDGRRRSPGSSLGPADTPSVPASRSTRRWDTACSGPSRASTPASASPSASACVPNGAYATTCRPAAGPSALSGAVRTTRMTRIPGSRRQVRPVAYKLARPRQQ